MDKLYCSRMGMLVQVADIVTYRMCQHPRIALDCIHDYFQCGRTAMDYRVCSPRNVVIIQCVKLSKSV